jgi:hypothetical protein
MASRARRLNVDPNGRDLGRCGLYRPRAVEVPAWDHFDAGSASVLTGRSGVAARQALNNLADSGVLEQVTVGKRNRMWESIGLFALIDEMERELSAGLRGSAGTQ